MKLFNTFNPAGVANGQAVLEDAGFIVCATKITGATIVRVFSDTVGSTIISEADFNAELAGSFSLTLPLRDRMNDVIGTLYLPFAGNGNVITQSKLIDTSDVAIVSVKGISGNFLVDKVELLDMLVTEFGLVI